MQRDSLPLSMRQTTTCFETQYVYFQINKTSYDTLQTRDMGKTEKQ